MAEFDDTDLPLPPPPLPPTATLTSTSEESTHIGTVPCCVKTEESPSTLETTCRILFKDEYFAFLIHLHMKNILKDGKVDAFDVPDIVAILVELLQRQPKLKVTADDLPEVLRVMFDVVLEQFDVHVPATEHAQLLRLIESSTRLVLLQPAIKANCGKWIDKIKTCWCF